MYNFVKNIFLKNVLLFNSECIHILIIMRKTYKTVLKLSKIFLFITNIKEHQLFHYSGTHISRAKIMVYYAKLYNKTW